MPPPRIHPTASIGGVPEHRSFIWAYYNGQTVKFLPPEIHETAVVHAFCTVDAGIKQPTRIGANSFLMARCHLGHDVQLGSNCELGAGTVVCGGVTIGDQVQIGGNTWIRPDVKVGSGARIGGGSVVVKDIPAGQVWAGNPAQPLRKGREAKSRGQIIPLHPVA